MGFAVGVVLMAMITAMVIRLVVCVVLRWRVMRHRANPTLGW